MSCIIVKNTTLFQSSLQNAQKESILHHNSHFMCLVVARRVTVSMGSWFVFSFSQAFWAAVVGEKGSIDKKRKKVPIVESSSIIEERCPLEKTIGANVTEEKIVPI